MSRDTIVSRDTIAIAATGATLLIAVIAAGTLNHQSISSLRHDVHGDIAALRQDMGTVRGELTALRTDVADFRERVIRDIGALSERISRLEVEVGTLKIEVGTLQVEVGSLQAEVGALKVEVGTLKGARHEA